MPQSKTVVTVVRDLDLEDVATDGREISVDADFFFFFTFSKCARSQLEL